MSLRKEVDTSRVSIYNTTMEGVLIFTSVEEASRPAEVLAEVSERVPGTQEAVDKKGRNSQS